jgi:hypothetical protein
VIFSDGIDQLTKKNEVEDLINNASERDVTYYTIGMDSPDRCGGFQSDSLERLAAQTNGAYVHHDSKEGRAQALALFDRISGQRKQYKLTYQTRAGEGEHKVCVRVKTAVGQPESCKVFHSPIRLPKLEISAFPTSLEKGKGHAVLVTPTYAPLDGIRREPKKIVYLVDGIQVAEVITAPFKFEWDVSKVEREGIHTIEARLYDSILPDTSYSSSNQVQVQVKFTFLENLGIWVGQHWMTLLLVPVVIVLLILILLMRRQIRQGVRMATSGIRAVTQRLVGVKPKAKLVIIRGPNVGQEFLLTNQIVRIGRGSGLVDFVLTDSYVSNLHAVLTESQMGYSIADLGSANGTLVDKQPLQSGQNGQPGPAVLLRPGSVIELGQTTELRFERIGGTTRQLMP